MGKKAIGLSEEGILLSTLESPEVAPTEQSFLSIGKTFKDTAIYEEAEVEAITCDSEEDDEPEEEFYFKGADTLKFATTDYDPESCHKIYGGTLTENKKRWTAPSRIMTRHVAAKWKTRTGLEMQHDLWVMRSRMILDVKKGTYGKIEHTLKKLKVRAEGAKSWGIDDTSISAT